MIKDELIQYYNELIKYYQNNKPENVKRIIEIKDILFNINFRQNIITELQYKYECENIEFNTNNNLMIFSNGVYDNMNGSFRDGKYHDRMTIAVAYEYEKPKNLKMINNYMESLFTQKQEREYILMLLRGCLFNNDKKIINFCGYNIDNKILFINLIRDVFENNEKTINNIKEIENINENYKIIIVMNDKNILDELIRRKINSNIIYVSNVIPKINNTNIILSEKLISVYLDPTELILSSFISDNIKKEFIYLLLTFKNKMIEPSTRNLEWKNKYDGNKNVYIKFLECCTIKSDDYIKLSDMYAKFIEWVKIKLKNEKIPGYKEWCNEIKKYKIVKKIKIKKTTANVISNISLN